MSQVTMYPGMTNSPQTELSSAISDIVVTIPLVDASKLPAAPNLATIGTDETAETILYSGKSGNNLTGVTRGVEGTAKSWSVGAKISRNYTNSDYEAMRENISDLNVMVGGKQDEITVLDELPIDVSSYPIGSLIMVRNSIYWSDDFAGTVIDTNKWHVYQSTAGLVTQANSLKLDSTSNVINTAFVYNKSGIRNDISGKLIARIKRVNTTTAAEGVLEVYKTKMQNVSISIWTDLIFIVTAINNTIQLRVVDENEVHNRWNDVSKAWEVGTAPFTNFSLILNEILKIEVNINLTTNGLSFKLENETTGQIEKTSDFPLSNVLAGSNYWYPHMTDTSTTVTRNLNWLNINYKRLGD